MKTKLRKKQNSKHLNPKYWNDILKLYDACLNNATDLSEEADLLYKHGHYARAFALAITAYEEIGKSQIVADLFNDMVSENEFNDAFKIHEIKSAYNARKFILNMKNLDSSHIDYKLKSGKKYNKWRIAATYVDCFNEYKTQEPKNLISKENAKEAIDTVNHEIEEIHKMAYLTERIGSKSFMK